MITAKNYAAQAEQALRDRKDKRYLYEANVIAAAQHFVLPDNGSLFDDNLKGLIGRPVSLPYEKITVEFAIQPPVTLNNVGDEFVADKQLCIASYANGFTTIKTILHIKDKGWNPLSLYFKIPNQESFQFGFTAMSYFHDDLASQDVDREMERVQALDKTTDKQDLLDNIFAGQVTCLFELLEALSCRNVSAVNYQDASPANVKRVKAGKLPFYETKMLVIETHSSTSGKPGKGGGSHASPRQHLRRGHIRRLESGNIWVNSCVVGDPNKGVINKQYAVI